MVAVRILLSDGERIQISGNKTSVIVEKLNKSALAGIALVEIDNGTYVNPKQVTSVFQVGSDE